jgi:hypothetical protein
MSSERQFSDISHSRTLATQGASRPRVVIVGAALDEKVDEIAALMREFLAKQKLSWRQAMTDITAVGTFRLGDRIEKRLEPVP